MTAVVFGYDNQDAATIDLERWGRLAEQVLAAEGVAIGELTLSFVTEADMAELHLEHMSESGATDVLSFPLDAELSATAAGERGPDDEPLLLGDVVVCPQVAVLNAPTHAGSVDDELALLVVHGVLHVLGYDHVEPSETLTMQARERELLQAFHWQGPAPASFIAHRAIA